MLMTNYQMTKLGKEIIKRAEWKNNSLSIDLCDIVDIMRKFKTANPLYIIFHAARIDISIILR